MMSATEVLDLIQIIGPEALADLRSPLTDDEINLIGGFLRDERQLPAMAVLATDNAGNIRSDAAWAQLKQMCEARQ